MAKPNPNLWAVAIRVGKDTIDIEKLWICAPHVKSAQTKALRFGRAKYGPTVRITSITWEGEIDVF